MAAEISVRASAMEGASMRDLATPPLESSSVMGAKPREDLPTM